MGCGLATNKAQQSATDPADEVRKRLSVQNVDFDTKPVGSDEHAQEREEDRSLLMSLSQAQILERIQEAGQVGRKFSISSDTDKALNKSNSFSSKTTNLDGDSTLCVQNESIGYACKKGLKPEAPNQDSFFICKVEDAYSLYGVFDGHGRKGHDVSNFVKDMLPKIFLTDPHVLEEPLRALREAFETTQRLIEQATKMERLDANRSGSTASVILHDTKKRMLFTAHVGDSRCVIGKKVRTETGTDDDGKEAAKDKGVYIANDLTEDHKPNLPAEKARIERLGGQVKFDGGFNYRVYAKGKRYPGLNMSRAMGDLLGFHDAGISASPDVAEHTIEHQVSPSKSGDGGDLTLVHPNEKADHPHAPDSTGQADDQADEAAAAKRRPSTVSNASCAPSVSSFCIDPSVDKFVILASDGVWEFMSSDEAVQLVSKFKATEAMSAAEHLASAAWDRWMTNMKGEVVDDITAIIIFLEPQRKG